MYPYYHYRSMDSPYPPHHRPQMPPSPHPHPYFPSYEPIPPHMKTPPLSYEPWPHGCNYGYPMQPMDCHGCCGHSHFPHHYTFRPPQPVPCHMPYPSLPEPHYHHPVHYSMEQPRYEYDKDRHSELSCRCPYYHHPRGRREESSGVKIEEHEPEIERRNGDDSLVPSGVRDFPYPVVWLPSGYMRDRDEGRPNESKVKIIEEEKPKVWNGWFPLDMNNFRSMKDEDTEKEEMQKQRKEDKNQFPFPIFWMPYKPDELGSKDQIETNSVQNSVKELPNSNHLGIGPVAGKPDGEVGSKPSEKDANPKTIPVKQLEQKGEKKNDEKAGGNSEKKTESDEEKTVKKQQSSPTKASKLPPVCLRIDPLPRRRNGGSSSRSPSPPGVKKSEHADSRSPKSSTCSKESKKNLASTVHETKQEDSSISTRNGSPLTSEVNTREELNTGEGGKDTKIRDGDIDSDSRDAKGLSNVRKEKSEEEMKAKRKNLSEAEAAAMIQSAYRGFEVRRWEPLKKLKQIAQVQEEVLGVRSRIKALQSSGGEIDYKQRVMIGETIMSLLLKLDTIQGLHPDVRDLRKAVAKELVSLQETLDSLGANQGSAAKISDNVENDLDTKEEQKEEKEKLEENTAEGIQALGPVGSGPEETLPLVEEVVEEGLENKNIELASRGDEVELKADMKPDLGEEAELPGDGQMMVPDRREDGREDLKIEQCVDVPAAAVAQQETGFAVDVPRESSLVDGSISPDKDAAMNLLPNVESDKESVVEELRSQGQIGQGTNVVLPVDSNVATNATQPDDEVATVDETESPLQDALVQVQSKARSEYNTEAPQNEVAHVDEFVEVAGGEAGEVVPNEEVKKLDKKDSENSAGLEASVVKPDSEFSLMDTKLDERKPLDEDHGATDADDTSTQLVVVNEVPIEEDTEETIEEVTVEGTERSTGFETMKPLSPEKPMESEAWEGSEFGAAASDRRIMEENERLREMMEKLLEAGKAQLSTISKLTGRVKDLERKLAQKKLKRRRFKGSQKQKQHQLDLHAMEL